MGAREDAKKRLANAAIPGSGIDHIKLDLDVKTGWLKRDTGKFVDLCAWQAAWLDDAVMYGAKYANERAKERRMNTMDNRFVYGQDVARGYKAFNADWTCMGKQYTCPGIFHEDWPISVCLRGMHFCEDLSSVFSFYEYTPEIHVCEVISMGEVERSADNRKCCCTDLVVVRELTHDEIIANTNLYSDNKGVNNTGQENTGNWNAGNKNTGNRNTGNKNTGNRNSGDYNLGSCNTGDSNHGGRNTGSYNTGDYNTGFRNNGNANAGRFNAGSFNTGDHNIGNHNTGSFNVGDNHVGWFNTEKEPLYMFNKPVPNLDAKDRSILQDFDKAIEMCDSTRRQEWWDERCSIQNEVVSLPNFDPEIFKVCTGIDARKAVIKVARCTELRMDATIADGYFATMKFPDGHEIEMLVDGYTVTKNPDADADILGYECEHLLNCYKADERMVKVWVK